MLLLMLYEEVLLLVVCPTTYNSKFWISANLTGRKRKQFYLKVVLIFISFIKNETEKFPFV